MDGKANQFNEARHYMYNEDDVDKVREQESLVLLVNTCMPVIKINRLSN